MKTVVKISLVMYAGLLYPTLGIESPQQEDITVRNMTDHTVHTAVYTKDSIADFKGPKCLYGGVHEVCPEHVVTLKRPAGFKWKFGVRDIYFSKNKDELVHELHQNSPLRLNRQCCNVGSRQGTAFAIAPGTMDKANNKVVDHQGTQLTGGQEAQTAKELDDSKQAAERNQPPL